MTFENKDLLAHNLIYFSKNQPNILLNNHNAVLSNYRIISKGLTNSLDLYVNGLSVYNGCAEQFATNEFKHFANKLAEHPYQGWLAPCFKGTFSDIPRLFHETREKIYDQTPLSKKNQWRGYRTIHPLPLLCVLGVGLGFHIKKLVVSGLAQELLIYEPEIESLIASFHVTDWEAVQQLANKKGIKLTWISYPDKEKSEAILYTELLSRFPRYPFCHSIYAHHGSERWESLIEALNRKFILKLHGMGNYDDEINQLNQAIFNTRNFSIKLMQQSKTTLNLPAIIVAGGPSLDSRIDQLRRIAPYAIIISAGSTLVTLHRYGIKPDMHVALESDQLATDVIKAINDPAYLKAIPLFGPIQLSPCLIEHFKDFYSYFRAEGNMRSFFGVQDGTEISGIPNCLNLALIVALLLGFKRFYLFGTDLGFKHQNKHHAQHSMYYDDNIHSVNRSAVNFSEKDLVETVGVDGNPIFTELFYLQAKESLERMISKLPTQFEFYNCSDGAAIKGTHWLSYTSLEPHFKDQLRDCDHITERQWTAIRQIEIQTILSQPMLGIDYAYIKKRAEEVIDHLSEIESFVQRITVNPPKDEAALIKIAQQLIERYHPNNKHLDPFTLTLTFTSLWLLIYDGVGHTLSLEEEDARVFLQGWTHAIGHFFSEIPGHTQSIIEDAIHNIDNPYAKKSIYSV